jgi:hypothetical protein
MQGPQMQTREATRRSAAQTTKPSLSREPAGSYPTRTTKKAMATYWQATATIVNA